MTVGKNPLKNKERSESSSRCTYTYVQVRDSISRPNTGLLHLADVSQYDFSKEYSMFYAKNIMNFFSTKNFDVIVVEAMNSLILEFKSPFHFVST